MSAAVLSGGPVKAADELFDPQSAASLQLSIQLDSHSLALAILQPGSKKFLALESAAGDPASLLKNNEWCKLPFKSFTATWSSRRCALIPDSVFEQDKRKELFYFQFSEEKNEKIHSDALPELHARMLFSIPESIEKQLKESLPGIRIGHRSTAFLTSVLRASKHKTETACYIDLHEAGVHVVAMKDGELLISNIYPCTANEETAYYVMFAYEQLKLNPEKIHLQLAGNIDKNSDLHHLLLKYVRNVRFMEDPAAFEYSYKFKELPTYRFHSLFSQTLCI